MSQPISPAASVRRASLDGVLSYAWETGVFTASDAMRAVGLTRSTTIDVIEELVVRGLLRELPNARAVGDYQKGRPARRFELRADAFNIFNHTQFDVVGTTFTTPATFGKVTSTRNERSFMVGARIQF